MPVKRIFYDANGNAVTRISEYGAPPPTGMYASRQEALNARDSQSRQNQESAYDVGYKRGTKEWYDDPDVQMLRSRAEDLAKGYEGQELGARREEARSQVQGQRGQYLRQLAGRTGRAGIGGARAAAMQAGADKGFLESVSGAERKLAADSAELQRKGFGTVADIIFQQKYGREAAATAAEQAELARENARTQAAANRGGGGGTWFCTEIHKISPWTLGQMRALKKLSQIAKEVDPELANMYFKDGGELVKKMNEQGFDWLSIKPAIEEIISYIKEDRFEEAYYSYKIMTQGLTVIYWR